MVKEKPRVSKDAKYEDVMQEVIEDEERDNNVSGGMTALHLQLMQRIVDDCEPVPGALLQLSQKHEMFEDLKLYPVGLVAASGNIDLLKKFINDGYNVDTPCSTNGSTALMLATLNKHLQTIEFLLMNGADVTLTNEEGNNVFLISVQTMNSKVVQLLWPYARNLDTEQLINHKNKDGWSCLHFAVDKRWDKCVSFLINNRVNVNAQTRDGVTPLMMAAEKKVGVKIFEMLMDAGADPSLEDKFGQTVLCHIFEDEHIQLFSAVVNKMSDKAIENVIKGRIERMRVVSQNMQVLGHSLNGTIFPMLARMIMSERFREDVYRLKLVTNLVLLFTKHHKNTDVAVAALFLCGICIEAEQTPYKFRIVDQFIKAKGGEFVMKAIKANNKVSDEAKGQCLFPLKCGFQCPEGMAWVNKHSHELMGHLHETQIPNFLLGLTFPIDIADINDTFQSRMGNLLELRAVIRGDKMIIEEMAEKARQNRKRERKRALRMNKQEKMNAKPDRNSPDNEVPIEGPKVVEKVPEKNKAKKNKRGQAAILGEDSSSAATFITINGIRTTLDVVTVTEEQTSNNAADGWGKEGGDNSVVNSAAVEWSTVSNKRERKHVGNISDHVTPDTGPRHVIQGKDESHQRKPQQANDVINRVSSNVEINTTPAWSTPNTNYASAARFNPSQLNVTNVTIDEKGKVIVKQQYDEEFPSLGVNTNANKPNIGTKEDNKLSKPENITPNNNNQEQVKSLSEVVSSLLGHANNKQQEPTLAENKPSKDNVAEKQLPERRHEGANNVQSQNIVNTSDNPWHRNGKDDTIRKLMNLLDSNNTRDDPGRQKLIQQMLEQITGNDGPGTQVGSEKTAGSRDAKDAGVVGTGSQGCILEDPAIVRSQLPLNPAVSVESKNRVTTNEQSKNHVTMYEQSKNHVAMYKQSKNHVATYEPSVAGSQTAPFSKSSMTQSGPQYVQSEKQGNHIQGNTYPQYLPTNNTISVQTSYQTSPAIPAAPPGLQPRLQTGQSFNPGSVPHPLPVQTVLPPQQHPSVIQQPMRALGPAYSGGSGPMPAAINPGPGYQVHAHSGQNVSMVQKRPTCPQGYCQPSAVTTLYNLHQGQLTHVQRDFVAQPNVGTRNGYDVTTKSSAMEPSIPNNGHNQVVGYGTNTNMVNGKMTYTTSVIQENVNMSKEWSQQGGRVNEKQLNIRPINNLSGADGYISDENNENDDVSRQRIEDECNTSQHAITTNNAAYTSPGKSYAAATSNCCDIVKSESSQAETVVSNIPEVVPSSKATLSSAPENNNRAIQFDQSSLQRLLKGFAVAQKLGHLPMTSNNPGGLPTDRTQRESTAKGNQNPKKSERPENKSEHRKLALAVGANRPGNKSSCPDDDDVIEFASPSELRSDDEDDNETKEEDKSELLVFPGFHDMADTEKHVILQEKYDMITRLQRFHLANYYRTHCMGEGMESSVYRHNFHYYASAIGETEESIKALLASEMADVCGAPSHRSQCHVDCGRDIFNSRPKPDVSVLDTKVTQGEAVSSRVGIPQSFATASDRQPSYHSVLDDNCLELSSLSQDSAASQLPVTSSESSLFGPQLRDGFLVISNGCKRYQGKTDVPCPFPWKVRSTRWNSKLSAIHNLEPSKLRRIGDVIIPSQYNFEHMIKFSDSLATLGFLVDGTEVAVTIIDLSSRHIDAKDVMALTSTKFSHYFLNKYHMFIFEETKCYIVMELFEYTLSEYLLKMSSDQLMDSISVNKLAWQLLKGLAFLHEQTTSVHGNMMPSNVLIDVEGKPQLCEYGIPRQDSSAEPLLTSLPVTEDRRCWIPTEIATEEVDTFTDKCDIQVTGMLMFYILTLGKHPYGDSNLEIQVNIQQNWPSLTCDVISEEARHLLQSMLGSPAGSRPEIGALLKHPYFWADEKKLRFVLIAGSDVLRDMKLCGKMSPLLSAAPVDSMIDILNKSTTDQDFSDWVNRVDRTIMSEMRSFRTYKHTLAEFVLFVYNCCLHFDKLSPVARQVIDEPCKYFLTTFPNLFIAVYGAIRGSSRATKTCYKPFF